MTTSDTAAGPGAARRDGPDRLHRPRVAGAAADRRGVPLIVDLVDRGIIRILDVAFIAKDEDGTVGALDLATSATDGGLQRVRGRLVRPARPGRPRGGRQRARAGHSAAVLVWENRWAAPVAIAMRRSGGQLVASGRIPVQAILAALDALEATN